MGEKIEEILIEEETLREEEISTKDVVSNQDKTITPPQIPQTQGTQYQNNDFRAGNLTRYLSNWELITNNKFILNIIANGYKIQFFSSKLYLPPVISTPSKSKLLSLKEEVNKLLNLGVIEETEKRNSCILSRIFTVQKPNGDNRLIIDLSNLNKFIKKCSFRMEDKNVIKSLIRPGDFLVSIDLENAFFSVPLHPSSKRFVNFELDGRRYAFRVLPFGMTSSPRVFSKILKPVMNYLRHSGMRITSYLDDILIFSDSYESCLEKLNRALSLLISLGFYINYNKSNLIPSQKILHLGYIWNSVEMLVSLPEEKLYKIKTLAVFCLNNNCSIRTLAKLLGLLVSSQTGFKLAPLYFRCFQINFIRALKCSMDWDSIWILNKEAKLDLMWWSRAKIKDLYPVEINLENYDLSIFTDASNVGWGAFLSSGEMTSGTWSLEDSKSISIG